MDINDVVRLNDDRPADGLAAGARGTVVHVFDKPRTAYEVEFVADDGSTFATATLLPDEVRPA